MSQAPGLSGMPDSGHCSSAATSASCARSSARPTSRTMRARPAMSLGDSIRQTASMVRWVVGAVTATDHTILHAGIASARLRRHDPCAGRTSTASRGIRPRPPARRRGSPSISCTWRTSITSLSDAGQRDAHSMASSFDFTWIIQ